MTKPAFCGWNKGKGAAIKWIRDNAGYQGDDCLTWPFGRHVQWGYGTFGYLGRQHYAHRFMCELSHGAPPTPKHHAAHSCGRGQHGCVNPKHIDWKTASENMQDRNLHGNNGWNNRTVRYKLTEEQVAEIRALTGQKLAPIAARFGVTESCIRRVQTGKTWQTGKRAVGSPLDETKVREILALRKSGLTYQAIGDRFGVRANTIHAIVSGQRWAHVSRADGAYAP